MEWVEHHRVVLQVKCHGVVGVVQKFGGSVTRGGKYPEVRWEKHHGFAL